MHYQKAFALAGALGLSLAGCGGGGGSMSGPAPTYSFGGTVTGLVGTVVLANSAGQSQSISANGAFTIGANVMSGTTYNVTVSTQPNGQNCGVAGGSGTV